MPDTTQRPFVIRYLQPQTVTIYAADEQEAERKLHEGAFTSDSVRNIARPLVEILTVEEANPSPAASALPDTL